MNTEEFTRERYMTLSETLSDEYAKLAIQHKKVLEEHNALLKKHLEAVDMLSNHKKLLEDHNGLLKKHMEALNELEAARGELTEVKDLTLTYVSEELDKLYTAICDDTDAEFIKMCEQIYEDDSLSVFRKSAALDRLYGSHLRNAEKKEMMARLQRGREVQQEFEAFKKDIAANKEEVCVTSEGHVYRVKNRVAVRQDDFYESPLPHQELAATEVKKSSSGVVDEWREELLRTK